MAAPAPHEPASVTGRPAVERDDPAPAAPTVFGPTGVDAAGLAARSTQKLAVTTTGGATTTIRVHGELLQETAPAFSDAVQPHADDSAVSDMVVDLRETTFMDSTGLGCLVSLRNQVLVRGARFSLVRPGDRVFRLFELTRLDTVFEFVEAD